MADPIVVRAEREDDFDYDRAPTRLRPSLTTAWWSLHGSKAFFSSVDAMASGDPFWIAAGHALLAYDPVGMSFAERYSNESIARVRSFSVRHPDVWLIYDDDKGEPRIARLRDGELGNLPGLPGGAEPSTVVTSPSGDVCVLSSEGLVFEYSPMGPVWQPLDTKGFRISSLALSSPLNSWAIGADERGDLQLIRVQPNGHWRPDYSVEPNLWEWVGIGPDDTAWCCANLLTKLDVYAKAPGRDAFWTHLGTLDGQFINGAYAAAPGRHLIAIRATNRHETRLAIEALSFGVADQEAIGWPWQTDAEKVAYEAAWSSVLGLRRPIREEYPNANASRDLWRSRLDAHVQPPEGVDETAWTSVRQQLVRELIYVSSAFTLFQNIEALNSQLGIMTALQMPGVREAVELDEKTHRDRTVTLVVGAMFKAGVGRLIFLLPAPASTAGSLVLAGLWAAIDAYGGSDPDAQVALKLYEVEQRIADVYADSVTRNRKLLASIVEDWGRLKDVGENIENAVWDWPVDETAALVATAKTGIRLGLFQSLMSAKWKVVAWQHVPVYEGPPIPVPPLTIDAPAYAAHWECGPLGPDHYRFCDVLVCNELMASHRAGTDLGPFPSEALVRLIGDLVPEGRGEAERLAMLAGTHGWRLTRVTGQYK